MPYRDKKNKEEPNEPLRDHQAGPDGFVASHFLIMARTDFSESTFLLEILHPAMAKAAQPGQFVIVITH
ncbi:MAG: hypothetical protein GXP03_01895, partial [Alphaproteobacteria bacterium]|nr:hypothetical protein [Alphaproteobacteria bacterium]